MAGTTFREGVSLTRGGERKGAGRTITAVAGTESGLAPRTGSVPGFRVGAGVGRGATRISAGLDAGGTTMVCGEESGGPRRIFGSVVAPKATPVTSATVSTRASASLMIHPLSAENLQRVIGSGKRELKGL